MRLLEFKGDGELRLTKIFINNIPPYAILSHTWGNDEEEITFQDLADLVDRSEQARDKILKIKTKAGFGKIQFCGEQAARDNLRYFWVDTCCIDKSNNTELSEAINSMFRWYRNAARCYVYLADLSTANGHSNNQPDLWQTSFQQSRWFTRGWTLQELIAPSLVEFFSVEGMPLGDKKSLERQVQEITGIAIQALRGDAPSEFSVAERMAWAKTRRTTREEDRAYSLLGIFDVCMPLIYGEGEDKAFRRLRGEISALVGELNLPSAVEAPFNAYQRQHEPICLENTRVDLLREIYDWADGPNKSCIFWLNGLAGTGKSTVARTVARKYDEKRCLGASFFFVRGGGDVGRAEKFVTTIATQLACSVPALHQHICDAVVDRSDIASQSLRDQWHHLVLGPLSKLEPDDHNYQSSYVLVVDALDECEEENNVRIIPQLLAEARSLENVRLRIFLTSRSEIPIRHGFCHIPDAEHQDFVLHNISPPIIDHDIRVFLEHDMSLIRQELSLGPGWPSEEAIRCLVQRASGLFIWAATACRFIRQGRHFAAKRLETIVTNSGGSVTAPEKHLNQIYITVLKQSVSEEYTNEEKEELYYMLRQILGSIVLLFSPLSINSLSRLLCVASDDISQTLDDLHSVLDIPKDQAKPLRIHHPSFRDFLLDSDKCTNPNFWVNDKQAHQELTYKCVRLMSTCLKQDVCAVEKPGVLVTNVEISRIKRSLPPEVQYACLYWVQHLQRSSLQLYDDDQVHRFLQEHLLYWFEALAWMGKISQGVLMINSLESLTTGRRCLEISSFVSDAKRFLLYNRTVIEQAPLQTYCGALVFAPLTSIVRKQFGRCIPRWIRSPPQVEDNWNALLQTLEGHSGSVRAVAFSDGLLASASSDGTIMLWEANSGALVQILEGHLHGIEAIAFSPDGTILVSGGLLNTIKLWDTSSGVMLKTLEGHSGEVKAIAFSPDGKLLASISGGVIELWDTGSWLILRTLDSHSEQINDIAFSPAGLLASVSEDAIIKLWDANSGVLLQSLNSKLDWIEAIAFSPDGKLLATASRDGNIQLRDSISGAALQTLEGDSTFLQAVAFSPDGLLIASASIAGFIELWDAGSGEILSTLDGYSYSVYDVAFSPDGKLLASASEDCVIRLWNASSGSVQVREGHSDSIRALAFSPDGKLFASASVDQTVKLWETSSGAVLQTFEVWFGDRIDLSFSDDGTILQTNIGPLCNISSESATVSRPKPRPSISIEDQWLCRGTENILWLPSEYRPKPFIVHGGIVGFGYPSGRVMFMEFAFED